jgi:protein-disulfide isomerase
MFRTVLAGTLAVSLGAVAGTAQATSEHETDIVALKNDVQQLKAQQQLILDRLDELKKLLKEGSKAQPAIKAPDTMSVSGELFRGEATAPLAIIEYGDIECPFCRRFKHDVYPQVLDVYIKTGKARFYYRDMPLPFHERAIPAARAAHCAGEQGKFWEMHDSLFTDKTATLTATDFNDRAGKLGIDIAKLDACMTSDRFVDVIQRSSEEAAKMEISGTPTFLIGTMSQNGDIVNVKKTVIGALPFEAFKTTIDSILSPANTPTVLPDQQGLKPVPDGVTHHAGTNQ